MGLWNKKSAEQSDDQSKSEADALIEKLGPVLEAIVKPIRDKVESFDSKFSKLEEEANNSISEEQRRAAAAADSELTPEQKLEKQNKALFAQNVLTNARITEQNCIESIRKEYPQLIPEFQAMCQRTNWETKALPNYDQMCMNAVDQLVGREARKNGLRYDNNNGKFLIEDAAARTGGGESPFNDPDLTWHDPRGGKTLTASQQLARLHIDPKDFEEFMKREGHFPA